MVLFFPIARKLAVNQRKCGLANPLQQGWVRRIHSNLNDWRIIFSRLLSVAVSLRLGLMFSIITLIHHSRILQTCVTGHNTKPYDVCNTYFMHRTNMSNAGWEGHWGFEAGWWNASLPLQELTSLHSFFWAGEFKMPPVTGFKLISSPLMVTSFLSGCFPLKITSEAPYSWPRLQLFLDNDPMWTTMEIAILTFYTMSGIVLLASLVSSCLIRKPRVYQKAIAFKSLFVSILGSIVWVLWQISTLKLIHSSFDWYQCREISTRRDTMLSPDSPIAGFFNVFIGNLPYILIPNVLYRLIKAYTGNLKGFGRGTERRLLFKVHASILTILAILFVTCILFQILMVSHVIPNANNSLKTYPWTQLSLAKCAIESLVSLEIIVEVLLLVLLRQRVSSRVGPSKRQPGKPFKLLTASRKEQSPAQLGRFSSSFWTSYGLRLL